MLEKLQNLSKLAIDFGGGFIATAKGKAILITIALVFLGGFINKLYNRIYDSGYNACEINYKDANEARLAENLKANAKLTELNKQLSALREQNAEQATAFQHELNAMVEKQAENNDELKAWLDEEINSALHTAMYGRVQE